MTYKLFAQYAYIAIDKQADNISIMVTHNLAADTTKSVLEANTT